MSWFGPYDQSWWPLIHFIHFLFIAAHIRKPKEDVRCDTSTNKKNKQLPKPEAQVQILSLSFFISETLGKLLNWSEESVSSSVNWPQQ